MAEARTRKHLLPLIVVGVLMAALDIAIVGPALPAIQRAFLLGERDVAWVFSIFVLFNLLGTPILAALSDRLGRRTLYLLAVALFTAGSALTAISQDFGVLLLGRAMQGVGAGGIFPVASALIWDNFPPNVRGRMLGLLGAVFGVAFLVGPILGGVLLLISWHWLFLVNIPVGLAILAAGLRILPRDSGHKGGPFDWAGILLLATILTTLMLGLTRLDTSRVRESLVAGNTWLLLFTCLMLVPLFLKVELGTRNPVVQVRLVSRRQVLLVALLAVGAGVAEAAVVFVPQLLKSAFAVDVSAASFMLVPLVASMAATSPIAGRLVDRFGPRAVLIFGSVLLTMGMMLKGFATLTVPQFYIASVLTGMGLAALLGAPLRYIMLTEAPAGSTASAQGTLILFISIGQLLGSVLISAVVAGRGAGVGSYQAAFTLVGALGLLLTMVACLLKARGRGKPNLGLPSSNTAGIAVERLEYAVDDSKRRLT
ncbi:MAG: MFS transporter [Chloroflexota bacterium]|nr:MFS transporter [Chloroflexota bacterium]MDQ5865475.1 MFS transporter [Chloroflexota bacterium]